MKTSIYIVLLIGVLAAPAAAQTTIKAIDSYAKGIERHNANKKNPKIVFVDTSDYAQDSKPKWRKFASEKALERYRETSETYSIAFAWTRGGKLIAVNFTLFSPSGDWAKYVYHFFRPDGTLAKAEIDYRTFHGDFIVEQDLYYTSDGKLLKKATAYKDLATGKPRKPPEAGDIDDNPSLRKSEIYKAVAKLPFSDLLKK